MNARTAAVVQSIVALIAVIALIVSVASLSSAIDSIQRSRHDAAVDSCYLLRALVLAAAPASRQRSATAYLARTPLRNCNAYGRNIVHPAPRKVSS